MNSMFWLASIAMLIAINELIAKKETPIGSAIILIIIGVWIGTSQELVGLDEAKTMLPIAYLLIVIGIIRTIKGALKL